MKRICLVLKMVFLIKVYQKIQSIFHALFWMCLKFGCWRYGEECRFLKDCMDTTYKISNLIKISPKRDGMLQKIRKDILLEYPRFRVLFPTRWTVRAESMKRFGMNQLMEICNQKLSPTSSAIIEQNMLSLICLLLF